MHDFAHKLLIQVQAAWRWRWYGLILSWIACCTGWIAVEFVPDRYISSARVHIDTESMLRPLMRGIAADVNTDFRTRLSLIRRTLLRRPNLEQIMRMTDLDIAVRDEVDNERILASLRARLLVSLEGSGENLFSVSFVDQDPKLARDVVQALLTLFVETNLGANREDLARTQRFLDGQLRGLTQRLNEAEQALARYRVEYHDYLPGRGNIQDELEAVTAEIEALERRRMEEIRVRDQVRREMASAAEAVGDGLDPLSPHGARVVELEQQLEELLTRYTDSHPDVIAAKRLLEYERQRNGQEKETGSESDGLPPRMQLLRVQVSEYNTRIASMDRRLSYLQEKLEPLRAAVRNIPTITSEDSRLAREYELIKLSQGELLGRREAARFAEELDTKTEPVQFRVLEPPNLPATPAAPNRRLLRSGVLLGGLGSGIGFAVLLSLAFPVIGSAEDLEEITGLPVIGTVAIVPLPKEMWQRRIANIFYLVTLAGLFGIFLLVLTGLPGRVLAIVT